jgi:drug/metabolite transporter (DMT)-like permease
MAMVLGIIFLREKIDAKLIVGSAMIVGGVLLTIK